MGLAEATTRDWRFPATPPAPVFLRGARWARGPSFPSQDGARATQEDVRMPPMHKLVLMPAMAAVLVILFIVLAWVLLPAFA